MKLISRCDSIVSFLSWVSGGKKGILLLISIMVAFPIVINGCDSGDNTLLSDIYFPVQKEVQSIYMDGSTYGELVLDGNYLRVERPGGNSELLVWPFGHSLRIEGKKIQIADNDGRVVAQVGDTIVAGGGRIPAKAIEEFIGESLPYDCEGPYFLVSRVVND